VQALLVLQEDVNESSQPWVHTINKNHEKLGEFHHLVPELKSIQPREKTYFEKPNTYKILSPYEWTNCIHEHFFLHTSMLPEIQKKLM